MLAFASIWCILSWRAFFDLTACAGGLIARRELTASIAEGRICGTGPIGGWPPAYHPPLVAVVAIVLSVTTAQAADRDFVPVNTETGKLPAIVQCLRQEKEAVLLSNGVECTDYRKGAAFLVGQAPNTPFNFDADRDCSKNSSRPADARHLSEDAIQRLLSDPKLTVRPSGTPIFGAIFCERVKLVGLELPFSLVLDKSVFAKGIEI